MTETKIGFSAFIIIRQALNFEVLFWKRNFALWLWKLNFEVWPSETNFGFWLDSILSSVQETNFGVFKRDGLNFEVVALTKPILEWLACFRPKRRKPMQNDCQMFPGILARLSPGGFFRDFRKTNFGFSEMAMLDKAFSYCALSGLSGLSKSWSIDEKKSCPMKEKRNSSYRCCLFFCSKFV